MASDDSQGMSLSIVSGLVLTLVTYLLWGGAAAIYKGHVDQIQSELAAAEEGSQPEAPDFSGVRVHHSRALAIEQGIEISIAGVFVFVKNSLTQLGNLSELIPYMLSQRKGYLTFSAVVLLLTSLGLWGLYQMQKSLAAGNPFSRNRRR